MKITIFNTEYNASYAFTCDNITEGRKIVQEQNNIRGWKDDDCYSEVEDD